MNFILTLVAAVTIASALSAETKQPITGVNRAYMDLTVSPIEDFYGYANGAFEKVPIPGEYASYGVNEEINERSYAIQKEIMETAAAKGGPKGSVAQRVGDFYAAGMDEPAIERAGLQRLQPWLTEVAAIKSPEDIVKTIGHLQAAGLEAGFTFGVQIDDKDTTAMIASFTQGGLGLPDRDYYTRQDSDAKDSRQAYGVHIGKMLAMAGTEAEAARRDAESIVALETKIAQASRTMIERDDVEKNYNKLERSALNKLSSDFAWDIFFAQIHFPAFEKSVLVGQPEFFSKFGELLHSEALESWRAYLRWHLLNQTADYLNHAFVGENFAFYRTKLSGITQLKPRWKRVLAAADTAIGEDIGQLYVQTSFSPEAKERALAMVNCHLEAMRGRIKHANWMSEATKEQAYKKIDSMRAKVGYPDHWRDYTPLTLTKDSYVGNMIAASTFEFQRQLTKLGKPVDRNEWQMTPQTNNAYYEPTLNEMCFPAGILQPPFFDEHADDATNYGALASTIGHELTHGFDDQGRKYNSAGNLKDWWTEEDAKEFNERAEFVAKEYDALEVLPGLHIDGHQTLGENIADIGGLRVAYEAFRLATANKRLAPVDGFTPDQRFFIAFAQGWRTNQRAEELRRRVASDVHSPVRWRVLGPVANFPEFQAAFGKLKPTETWPSIW